LYTPGQAAAINRSENPEPDIRMRDPATVILPATPIVARVS